MSLFILKDKTRRFLCRAAFVALCVAPTLGVLGWIVAIRRPGHVAAAAAVLSEQLGVEATLAGVSYPRPGVTLFENLQLADPETHAPIARLRLVEATRDGDALVLLLSQTEIETARLDRLWELLHERLLRQGASPQQDIQITAPEVTFRGDDASATLTGLLGRIGPSELGPAASFEFRIAGRDMPEPVQWQVVRNRQVSPPATRVELRTGGNRLSCATLSTYWPALRQLGPRCEFSGSIWTMRTADGWQGEATGRLSDVDLDRLISDRFAHKLSGSAEIAVRRAVFGEGRLGQIDGWMTAGPGVIDRSLIASAVKSMHLTASVASAGDVDALMPYRQLAFSFVLDADGLTLAGQCDGAPGVLLTDARGPLLAQPTDQPRPAVGLVQALVPQNDVQVPATQQTNALLHALPIPPIKTPGDIRAAEGRLRFGDPVEQR